MFLSEGVSLLEYQTVKISQLINVNITFTLYYNTSIWFAYHQKFIGKSLLFIKLIKYKKNNGGITSFRTRSHSETKLPEDQYFKWKIMYSLIF